MVVFWKEEKTEKREIINVAVNQSDSSELILGHDDDFIFLSDDDDDPLMKCNDTI